MKHIYTLIVATFISALGWGQYEVHLTGSTTDISIHTVNDVVPDSLVKTKIYIKNLSGSTQLMSVCRKRISAPSQWTNYLCWAPYPTDPLVEGACYGAAQMQGNPWCSPTVTVPNNGEAELISYIDVEQVVGFGLYRYYFKTGTTYVDSIDIQINATASIEDEEASVLGMTAYPNPANNQLTVNTMGIGGDYMLRITDVLGKVVYTEEVGAVKKVDISEFKNGVYLVTVLEKGTAIKTRRVVVKH